jgi:hypothetical protein
MRPASRRSGTRGLGLHRAAAFGALSAHFRTLHHQIVVAGEAFARIGAAFADVRAHAARLRVKVASPEHEIRAGRTDLGAVLKQPDVFRRRMFAAHRKTMADYLDAHRVAAKTVVDTFLNFFGYFFMCHFETP